MGRFSNVVDRWAVPPGLTMFGRTQADGYEDLISGCKRLTVATRPSLGSIAVRSVCAFYRHPEWASMRLTSGRGGSGPELAAALAAFPGTVTEFLERIAGEPIDADIRSQLVGRAAGGHTLGLAPEESVLRRAVVLRGRATERRFAYAQSVIAAEQLPEGVLQELERGEDPIGRILVAHGLSLRREPVPYPVSPWTVIEPRAHGLDESVMERHYRIIIDAVPVFDVSEWFLPPTARALTRSMAAADRTHQE